MSFATLFTKEGVKALLHDASYKVNEVKPEIFLISGGLSLLAGTILACYKTEKAKAVLAAHKEDVKEAENDANTLKLSAGNDEKALKQAKFEAGKAQVKLFILLIYKLFGVYGVPALLWLAGFGLITDGHFELRRREAALASQLAATTKLMNDYRSRNAQIMGPETEQRVFQGAEEKMIDVLETDPETGKETLVQKPATVFLHQPGSIFARNFTESTSDCFDIDYFAEKRLMARIEAMQLRLDTGSPRCYTGLDIYKALGFDENALGEDEFYDALRENGISGNARKVPDPEMRKIKCTILDGYEERYNEQTRRFYYVPCKRLDWNFYPLKGRV